MTTFIDRIDQGIERMAHGLRDGVERGRLGLEKTRLLSERRRIAAELGLLTWRKTRGKAEASVEDREALCLQLDDVEARLDKVERELATHRAEVVGVTTVDPSDGGADDPGAARSTT